MKVVLQRVSSARVEVSGEVIGTVDAGYLLLVGFRDGDGEEQVIWMADKIAGLRVFPDDGGLMNRSLVDVGGDALVVSQFTLYGNVARGRRPSFVDAARPEVATPLYESFVRAMRERIDGAVATGRFGAAMSVTLVNDGPVTLILER